MNFDYSMKVVIVGESNVGKTCLLLRLTHDKFEPCHEMTIGVDFGSKILQVDETHVKFQVWDTAGQEAFRSICISYLRGAAIALVVYDTTNRGSFERVCAWVDQVRRQHTAHVVVVGTKSDLKCRRQVSVHEGKALAEKENVGFCETSSKQTVDSVFEHAAREVLRLMQTTVVAGVHPSGFSRIPPPVPQHSCCAVT